MNGNVQGLPTIVPSTAATMLHRLTHSPIADNKMCRPMNGVNDIAAPHAKPPAMAWPEPGSLASGLNA